MFFRGIAIIAIPIFSFLGGGVLQAQFGGRVEAALGRVWAPIRSWDRQDSAAWQAPFERLDFLSSQDGTTQTAYALRQPEAGRPLLVSLHSWSGDYRQPDPLAAFAAREGWNYLHPDLRGANNRPEACLSALVLSDFEDLRRKVMAEWAVDPTQIYVVGVSGGGYTAAGLFQRSKWPVKAYHAWVPISDLALWQRQSAFRGNGYDADVAGCVAGAADPVAELRRRSPLYMGFDGHPGTRLHLYAGIRDGYEGSVPIIHALRLYNALAPAAARLSEARMTDLVTLLADDPQQSAHSRPVYLARQGGAVALTLFDGGHEMVVEDMERILRAQLED